MAKEERQVVEKKGGSGEGCPVEMQGGKRCGRPIHTEPGSTYDKENVCLMHSRDPGKNDAEFQREFEAILEGARDGVADSTGFVFPTGNYKERKFMAACSFLDATFTKGADFAGSMFAQSADFRDAMFTQEATFSSAKFNQSAYFGYAKFTKKAWFIRATFTGNATFNSAKFTERADFGSAKFMQDADFSRAKFRQYADFSSTGFIEKAFFATATFTYEAIFINASFTEDVSFNGATLTQGADFDNAKFKQVATLKGATFAKAAKFNGAKFMRETWFEGTKFLEGVEFRRTRFRHDKGGPERRLPGPIFSLAEFAQPEKVIFDRVYLGQTLFYRCDVSRVNFSLVTWRRRKGRHKRMLFEEVVSLEAAKDLKPSKRSIDERRYRLIAELYQQLKKNYDEKKDYWTAGDFHYGEMEMKRLGTKSPGRIGRMLGRLRFRMRRAAMRSLRHVGLNRWRAKRAAKRLPKQIGLNQDMVDGFWRWWHQGLSLVAWYKYASEYGESYARPVWCLALVLLLFTFLFPIVGLDWNDTKSPPGGTSAGQQTSSSSAGSNATQQASSQAVTTDLSYGHFSDFVKSYKGRRWLAGPAFVGNSLMTALSVAGFQKELKYEPSYPWGRALALLELLLTSTLAALFLLAVRRQFRR